MRPALLTLLLATLASAPALAQDDVRTLTGPGGREAGFGAAVAAAPDLNGDGTPDLLIGAPAAGGSFAGEAYVISGATDEILLTIVPPGAAIKAFGRAIDAVPDTDGDDVADVVIGASRDGGGGRAYIFSGASGALLRTLSTPSTSTSGVFGRDVAGTSDLDGDGRGDVLVVGSADVDPPRPQTVYVFSSATGALLYTLGTGVGAVASVPDADGDGIDDVLIGAENQGGTATSSPGQASLFSGASGTLLYTLDNPSGQNTNFGWAVTGGRPR